MMVTTPRMRDGALAFHDLVRRAVTGDLDASQRLAELRATFEEATTRA